jgi:hypothetical protein
LIDHALSIEHLAKPQGEATCPGVDKVEGHTPDEQSSNEGDKDNKRYII